MILILGEERRNLLADFCLFVVVVVQLFFLLWAFAPA